jgi:murein DD-endopeptidase MepM/ murein hydrolase activator NlpD
MKLKLFAIIILSLALAGCAATPRSLPAGSVHPATYMPTYTPSALPAVQTPAAVKPITHMVKRGETLWSISKLYNVDLETLAQANNIQDSTSISKGQILEIPGVTKKPESVNYVPSKSSFAWPVRGPIVASFGTKVDRGLNKGIDIKACEGIGVAASRSGRVVYCDSAMKGFGKTVILEHGDSFQTVYSCNSEILVKVGDVVRQQDIIARVGMTGRAKEPMLHFEIRKNGEPQNPMYYLSK